MGNRTEKSAKQWKGNDHVEFSIEGLELRVKDLGSRV